MPRRLTDRPSPRAPRRSPALGLVPAILALAALAALAVGGGGCPRADGPRVVVYASLDAMFSRPILETFERRTGIRVDLVTDQEAQKTTGLMNRLLQMKDRPEADVFWNNEAMRSIVLRRRGLLVPYDPPTARDIPARYRGAHGAWVGFAARARVLLYHTGRVAPTEAPTSIFELTEPRWKGRVAIANPLFGTTSTHVAALYAVIGAERTEAWLRGLKANGCRIVAGNAMARNLVAEGEIDCCLTDTDDANVALEKGKPVRMVYPDQEGIGTLVLPNSAVQIRGGPHPEAARRLIDFLTSPEVEARLARGPSAQIPLRPGVAPHSPAFDLRRIRAMDVDLEKAADRLDESTKFVQETFLR